MREPTKRTKLSHRRRISRTWRRAILASALIVVATPVSGENQQSQLKLRLPAATYTRSDGTIQQNPFFRVTPRNASPVALASGKEQSTIRLKPVGSAIGLQPIDSRPITVRPPAMAITMPTSTVHENPLISSEHHQNTDLVETSVEATNDRSDELDWDRRNKPASPTIGAGVPPTETGATNSKMLPTPKVMMPVPKQIIVPEAPLVAKQPVESPPLDQLVVPATPIASLPDTEPTQVTSIPTEMAEPRNLQPLPSAPIQDPAIEIEVVKPADIATTIPSTDEVASSESRAT